MEIGKKIEALVEQLQTITELFYQNKKQEGYQSMDGFLQNLINLTEALKNDSLIKKEDINKINSILKSALEALGQGDCVLLADILQYELQEELKALGQ